MAGIAFPSANFWKADRLVAGLRPSSQRGVNAALERLRALSVPLAPIDTGALRESATVVPARPVGISDLAGYLVFDTPYAAVQHEDLDYHHQEGQAKYVEQPMRAHQRELLEIIGGEVRVGIVRS